jgi:hypothetical protein
LQTRTDFGAPGYGGPCPPEGDHPHRYLFTVFAVKADKLDVKADTSAAVVGFNLHFNTLAKAEDHGVVQKMNGTVLLKNAPTAGSATAASPQKSSARFQRALRCESGLRWFSYGCLQKRSVRCPTG